MTNHDEIITILKTEIARCGSILDDYATDPSLYPLSEATKDILTLIEVQEGK